MQDVVYAVRMLRRTPMLAVAVVLSLALAMSATAAVFSILNAFMLRKLPVREPDELVEFLSRYPGEPRMYSFGWADYERYRDHSRSFSAIIAAGPSKAPFEVETASGGRETVVGEYAVGDFFQSLGVRTAIGRLIGRADDRPGDDGVAVLSWPYWRARFNGDPSVIGTRIAVNGIPMTIVGVTSEDFLGLQPGRTPAVWVPSAMEATARRGSGPARHAVVILGRLRPGVSLDQARAEMRTLDRARVEGLATRSKDPAWLQATIEVEPAATGLAFLRDQYRSPLVVLMATVGTLLLIACLNIATMLSARGEGRRHEMAVRVALGAGRLRLVRLLFAEALLFALAGTLLGLAFAIPAARGLLRALPVDSRSGVRLEDVPLSLDGPMLIFAAGTTILTALVFGLAPAWTAFRCAAYTALRHGTTATPARQRYEKVLVTSQVAGAIVLGTAALLFVAHVSQLRDRNAGFSHDSVLLLTVEPTRAAESSDARLRTYQALLQRIRSIPGVHSATLAALTPIQGGAASQFMRVDGVDEPSETRRRVSLNWVAPQYFETVRTPLLSGRDFTDADEGGPPVVIVNRRLARHYFGDASPIGRTITLERGTDSYRIVGVVADAKYESLHEPAPATIYLHAYQGARGQVSQFAIRAAGDPDIVAPAVRQAVSDVAWNLEVRRMRTLREQVDASLVTERLLGKLSSALAGMGTLLVAIGLYGLLAFIVTSRTREIGIRMVLGATRTDVTWMVLRTAGLLLFAGTVIGVPLAWWVRAGATRMLPDLAVGVAAPVTAAAVLVAVVALVAAWLPARSASRVHPVEALRDR